MNRVVGPEVSTFYAGEHTRQGVHLHLNALLAAFDGDAEGRVVAAVDLDGRRFPADLVMVGVGVVPDTALAASAGLLCENGIAVDVHCRTSDPDIFAAGDCASHPSEHYRRRVRLESVDNAFEQGKSAALNMLGRSLVHDRIPWFWSDQYDLKLLIVGLNLDYDHSVLRGDPAARSFSLCYLREGELLAIDCVNSPKDYMAARKLIAERARLDLKRLGDASLALKDLML
jgi:3-phenylpropionate/trans-cinnamate dioxygenase ferredoxin reductase subunit